MRKFIAWLCILPFSVIALNARNNADDIVGNWLAEQDGIQSYVSITRSPEGTFTCQLFWVEDSIGPDGRKVLDVKNPDRSLRSVPIDEVVLFSGLKFNEKKNCWNGTKIYDPTRGIRANVTCTLSEDGNTLFLRGSVLGIGETVEWTRMDE